MSTFYVCRINHPNDQVLADNVVDTCFGKASIAGSSSWARRVFGRSCSNA
jgi:hypothetical protein